MKGKYAARSSLRREDEGVRSDIESYQHHIQRLSAENEELKGRLASLSKAHRDETRRLRAERDEGLSPQVAALNKALGREREKAAAARSNARENQEWYRNQYVNLRRLFQAVGLSEREAQEVVSLLGMDDDLLAKMDPLLWGTHTFVDPGKVQSPAARRGAIAIQAARGMRHADDVVSFFRDKILAAMAKEKAAASPVSET